VIQQEPVPPPEPAAKPVVRPELPPPGPGDVRVALLVPLSGRYADIGTGMLNAAQMAVFDVADDRLQLVPYDTGGGPEGAKAAAKKAVASQATLILGPLLSVSTRAVRPVAKEANIPVISFSSDRKVGGDSVYIIGFAPETEVDRVMTYAADNGARRFVILGPRDTYGDTVSQEAKKLAKERGFTIVRTELYDPKTTNFGLIIDRLRLIQPATPQPLPPAPSQMPGSGGTTAAPAPFVAPPPPLAFDAMLIADGGDRLRALTKQLAEKGLGPEQVRVLGTGAWDEPSLAKEPSLAGAWIAAPEPSFRDAFEARYRELYGKAPPRLATLGYDSTALAAVLARDRGREGHTNGWLTNPDGFFGRDGLFRLVPEGYADRRLAILQIAGDRTGVVSEAQRRFTGF
jgi:ABC-type branched-chain amino acid transport systems, periplasmic component